MERFGYFCPDQQRLYYGKNAEEQRRTIPENTSQEIQEEKKLQKPDDATFCNLFERKPPLLRPLYPEVPR